MISAIVLAAGLSSRMKERNKLLLPIEHKAMIAAVVNNLSGAGITEIIVVTGHDGMPVREALAGFAVKFVENSGYKKGMTSSIQAGVSIAEGDGFMICLGDLPFITGKEYLQLKNFFKTQYALDSACICVPMFQQKKGNPVIFSAQYKDRILQHESPEGCKEIVDANREHVYNLELSQNILKDIDTPEQYELSVCEE